ncbi:MAG TPA: SCO family protein [Reyranella sp.]|jgi:protein SCO1/2|nr:SCO family protein [Reyranella sp.]
MKSALVLLIPALWAIDGGRALAFDAFHQATIEDRRGAQLPLDTGFRDEHGNVVTLRQVGQGKPIVLAPVLHHCPNICGLTLAGLADAIAHQKYVVGRDFRVVAFGIDPHEGPADAADSLMRLRTAFPALQGGVVGLTGAAPDIAAVTQALGYRYAWDKDIGQYAHVAAVAILTPEGKLTRWLYGISPSANDLKLALTDAAQGRLGSLGDRFLLLCYHYDPKTGRYGPLIWIVLRAAGGAIVVLGGGLIAFALIRERRRSRRPVA